MKTTEDFLKARYNTKLDEINTTLSTATIISYPVFLAFYLDLQRCIFAECDQSKINLFAYSLINIKVITHSIQEKKDIANLKVELTNIINANPKIRK